MAAILWCAIHQAVHDLAQVVQDVHYNGAIKAALLLPTPRWIIDSINKL